MRPLCKLLGLSFVALLMIATFLGVSVETSANKNSFTVLWIWDVPFTISDIEFNIFKSLLSDHNAVVVYKDIFKFSIGQGVNWSLWLEAAGYDLVVVSWACPVYRDVLRSFS